VFNSNLGHILHHFRVTAAYRSKIAKIARLNPPHSHKSPSLGVKPCEFFGQVISCQKLKPWAIRRIRNQKSWHFPFWYNTGCNRRTDRQTDRHIALAKTRSTHSVARVMINVCEHVNTSEGNTRNSAKLTNQCVSYAFTSSPLSFHARHILPTSKFQHSYSSILLIFYINEQRVWELWVWIQFTGLTLPLQVMPINYPITLISPVQSLGYIFTSALA